jgi:hypothetical protein
MVKRKDKRRWRRVLILALLLLIPTLLSDLPLFSKTGHGHGAAPSAGQHGGGELALLPVAPGTLGVKPGKRHWHTASNAGDWGDQGEDRDGLLHNLVYLIGDKETLNGNAPLSDGGDPGFSFGGDGGGPRGGAGGPTGFGGPGYDPGTDILPLSSFTPDDGKDDKGGDGGNSGNPPFLSPTIPSIAAVPEPATWALFILGFGVIGAQLRRARDAARVPALTRTRTRRLG